MKSHQIVCLLFTNFYFSSNIQRTFGNKSKMITGNKNRLNNRSPLTFFYSKPPTNIRKNGNGFKHKFKRRLSSKKPKNGILGRRYLNLFHNYDLKKYHDKNFSPDFLNEKNLYKTHVKLNKDFSKEASNELYNGLIENSDEASTEEYDEGLIKNLDEILSEGSEKKLRKKLREESYRNSDEARKKFDEFENHSKKVLDRKFSRRSNDAIFGKLDKSKGLDNPKVTSEVQRRCLLLGAMMLLNYYDDENEEEEHPKRKRPKLPKLLSTSESPMDDEQASSDQPITEAPSLSKPLTEQTLSAEPITENPAEQDSALSKRKRHKNSEEFYSEIDDELITMFDEYADN